MNKEIVITSRIRLARNFKNYKFPMKMDMEEARTIIKDTNSAFERCNIPYKLSHMADLSNINKNILIENHLISPALVINKDVGACILSDNLKLSILINEEDHIRIQVFEDGLSLNKCWDFANKVDDILEETIDYDFDNDLGYITSCPTNIGTGMRASVMLHLPALSITNQVDKFMFGVSQLGVAVRGVYGEGTKSLGHLYQISNQGTLGASEETLIEKISQVVNQIVNKEKMTRDHIKKNNIFDLEDEVYRAYGLLTNARSMTTEEAMKLLSYVKLGKEMSIMYDKMENKNIYDLMVKIQPNNILSIEEKPLMERERDIKRAKIIRDELI